MMAAVGMNSQPMSSSSCPNSSLVVKQPLRHQKRVVQFLKEVVEASGVQDDADSRTHRIAAVVLRELQLRCLQ